MANLKLGLLWHRSGCISILSYRFSLPIRLPPVLLGLCIHVLRRTNYGQVIGLARISRAFLITRQWQPNEYECFVRFPILVKEVGGQKYEELSSPPLQVLP